MKRDDSKKKYKKKFRLTLLDKVNICLESLGDHVMHVFIDAGNQVNFERFKRAVRLSLDAEPILACRFVYKTWKPYWERWDTQTLDSFRLCSIEPQLDLEQQKHDFLLLEMDKSNKPFVQAKIIRGETDMICININCVAMDGGGLFIYLFRLFKIYNRLAFEPDYVPLPAGMDLRSVRNFSKTLSIIDKIKILFIGLRNQSINQKTANNWKFPASEGKSMQKTFYIKNFSTSTYTALNFYRRKLNATVNDVMLAAYFQSLYKIIQPENNGPFCVLNTYDLRKYLPIDSEPRAANYSSFINSNLYLQADTPFDEIVKRVKASISEQKKNYPGLGEAPPLWFLFSFLPFYLAKNIFEKLLRTRGGTVPVFTNVGVLNPEWFEIDGTTVRNIVPIQPLEYPPKFIVSLSTVGEKMAACIGYSETHFKRSDVERLFTLMEQAIPRIVSEKIPREKQGSLKNPGLKREGSYDR